MEMTGAMLFIIGFSSLASIYEIAKTGKKTKSDKIQRLADKVKKLK